MAPGEAGGPGGRGEAQDRQVGELEPQGEPGLGAQEELEEEGKPQALEHPRPAQAQEKPQEGKARHEAGPHQGGARPGQEEVEGQEEEGQEVAPPPQGQEGHRSYQKAHVEA